MDQRGKSLDIPGHKRLRLDHLTIIAHSADTSNTPSISRNSETVLFACWCDDGLPPLVTRTAPDLRNELAMNPAGVGGGLR